MPPISDDPKKHEIKSSGINDFLFGQFNVIELGDFAYHEVSVARLIPQPAIGNCLR